MTGRGEHSDPLGRIEMWANDLLVEDAECAMEKEGVMCGWSSDDREIAPLVLALVEIARAAREAEELLHNGYSAKAWDVLQAALTRLDSQ